jgi:hypothetical protein
LQFTSLALVLDHLESEVHANCGQIVIHEVVITEADEEGGFSYSLVPYDDDLKQKILLLDHAIIITILFN